MRLLVTGGAGFIGSEFVRMTLRDYPGDSVVVLDKLTYAGNERNLDSVRADPRFRFVRGDICDAAMVGELAADVDVIVNFAAESHVDRSLEAPGQFILTDVFGTFVLMDAARAHGHQRFVQVSTDEVYGEVNHGLSVEGDPLQPRSPYSASKAGGELQIQAFAAARTGACDDAREHLALAERLAWRARLPRALVVCGPPAAGKSLLAQALGERSGLEVVSADETRKTLTGVARTARAPRDAYATEVSARTYGELGRQAAACMAGSGGVIVDATFGQRNLREAFARAFGEAHPTIFCECRAPVDVLRRRARARISDPHRVSDAGPTIAARLAERFEPLEADISPQNHLVLRSDRPVGELASDIVAMLDSRLAGAETAEARR